MSLPESNKINPNLFNLKNYSYTDDFTATDSPDKIDNPTVNKKLKKLYQAISRKQSGYVPQAEKFFRNHQDVVLAKVYLIKAYQADFQTPRAKELNEELLQAFPDNLFARINRAIFEYFDHNPEKMIEYLGENLDLKSLLPNRKLFHLDEIISYLYASNLFLASQQRIKDAQHLVDMMHELDPRHYLSIEAEEMLAEERLKQSKIKEKKKEEKAQKIGHNVIPAQKENMPELHHQELMILYEEGILIESDELQKLLLLPRESLIKDLENILIDSIDRFNYFYDETDFDDQTHSFPVHAYFMLGELRATESLNTILYFLSMPEKLLTYWMGDLLLDKCWQVVYYTGNRQLEQLKNFIFNQKNYLYIASEISGTVEQIVYYEPERKKEVIEWYIDVIENLLEKHHQGEIINPELVSFLVWAIMNFRGEEVMSVIEKCFAEDLIEEEMVGDLEDVRQSFSKSSNNNYIRDLNTIFEIYNEYQHYKYRDEDDEDEFNVADLNWAEPGELISNLDYSQEPRRVEKIGRNEPCPCGSGKKYKKCCGKT